MSRLCLLLIAFSGAAAGFQPSSSIARVRAVRPATPIMMARKGGVIGIVDDVLDYLTNMGGYTGFTEEELKGGESLDKKDMTDFGKQTEGVNDNLTTTLFVILLIAFPSILGIIGVSIYGAPSLFTFAT